MSRAASIELYAASALQGILASGSMVFRGLDFREVVELAATYAEALAKRLDNPPQAEV